MPETENTEAAATPEGTPVVPAETVPTPEPTLTRADVLALIASNRQETETSLRREIESLSSSQRRTAGQYGDVNAKMARLEKHLEVVATRNMDETEARLWRAERTAEIATQSTDTVNRQQEYEQAQANFQVRSTAFLSSEGIDPKDARLTTAFAKYAAEAKSYADWDSALARAVADVHKDERKRVEADAKTSVEKAREEERAKVRNEQRASEGKLDRGAPVASTTKVDWTSISDEEFKANDPYSAEAIARRRRQTR